MPEDSRELLAINSWSEFHMTNAYASRNEIESSLKMRSDETLAPGGSSVEQAIETTVPCHRDYSFHLFLSLDDHNETVRQAAGKEVVGLAPTLQRGRLECHVLPDPLACFVQAQVREGDPIMALISR